MNRLQILFSKYGHYVAILIAMLMFAVPFFWFKQGYVDFGGDGPNLFFIDPLITFNNTFTPQNISGFFYSTIPYVFFQSIWKLIMVSPTSMIAVEHGLQLSLAFYAMYLVVKELLSHAEGKPDISLISAVSIVAGIVYVGFTTNMRWFVPLVTLNQIFLNPLMFYLLVRACITGTWIYPALAILLSLVYSVNFGLMSIPQLASFFPFALFFLYVYTRFVLHKTIPWVRVFGFVIVFFGVHCFHLLPVISSVLQKNSYLNVNNLSVKSIQSGVQYFDIIHEAFGKLSSALFQPNQWNAQSFLVVLIPLITVMGFFKKRSRILAISGIFFAVLFFLMAANITHIGVSFYRWLFTIPGFVMFRSFYEKWYSGFVFFYTTTFAFSLYFLLKGRKFWMTVIVSACVICSVCYRIIPFFTGDGIRKTIGKDNTISTIYSFDPDLFEALDFVKTLPSDGKALTVPLTFPNYQIAFGKDGGAYVGISLVRNLAGKQDIPGLWVLEPFKDKFLAAVRDQDVHKIVQILSALNVRYIFHNSDDRLFDTFPSYPNLGFDYSDAQIPDLMKNQKGYDELLHMIPAKVIYSKGFYSIYEIEESFIRPYIYIPDQTLKSEDASFHSSYRSAFVKSEVCRNVVCGDVPTIIPQVTYTEHSPVSFDLEINSFGRNSPFLLIVSNNYDPQWKLVLDNAINKEPMTPILVNGYANGWIIDPLNVKEGEIIHGRVYLMTHVYFLIGAGISALFLVVTFCIGIRKVLRRRYEKK